MSHGQPKRLDINTATVHQLESLRCVGITKAELIVGFRKQQHGFNSIDDLLNIPGLGNVFLEQNKSLICCNPRKTNHDRKKNSLPPTHGRRPKTRSGKSLNEDALKLSENKEPVIPMCTYSNKSTPPVTPSGPSSVLSTGPKSHRNKCRHLQRYIHKDDGQTDNDQNNQLDQPEENLPVIDIEQSKNILDQGISSEDRHTEQIVDSEITIKSSITSPNEKPLIKRRSDGKQSKSPPKKPCKNADITQSRVHQFGTIQTSITQSMSLAAMKRRIPSRSNPPADLAPWLKTFQCWSHAERLLALDEVISHCEPTQVRHIMSVIEPQFQRDFISLLPKELALYVLSFLEPKDLLQAAQTCNYWRILADDNLLWREKCREESIDQKLVYGHKILPSFPTINHRSLRRNRHSVSTHSNSDHTNHHHSNNIHTSNPAWKDLFMKQHQIELNWRHGTSNTPKVLKGHDDHVITCLEFCGNRIVSGSDDNTLKVWSADNGKCLRTLIGHTGGVWSSQMRDNIIISGSTDRTLKVWNADTGTCDRTLYGHTSTVRCMHLYKNRVVSGSRDATLRLWDITSGSCLHVLMGHVAAVRCVQYDGQHVVSGAYDYSVKVWDAASESCLHTLQGHTNRVYSLQFDGTHIVSGSLDTSIRVWDVETGNCLHTLIGHQSLTSGMELKDNILVSGNADSTVKVWDITTGQCLQTLQGPNKHQSAVTCLQFNKKFVITSSDDGTVKIWDLRRGEFVRNLVALDSGGSGGVVWRVRCSNTRLVCAVGSRNGTEETKLLVLDFDCDEPVLTEQNSEDKAVDTHSTASSCVATRQQAAALPDS